MTPTPPAAKMLTDSELSYYERTGQYPAGMSAAEFRALIAKQARMANAAPAAASALPPGIHPAPRDAYLIFYEDQDRAPELFAKIGASEAAWHRFAQASAAWSCHLFQRIATSVRDTLSTESALAGEEKAAGQAPVSDGGDAEAVGGNLPADTRAQAHCDERRLLEPAPAAPDAAPPFLTINPAPHAAPSGHSVTRTVTIASPTAAVDEEARAVAAALRGTSKHIRAIGQYKLLLGDADWMDKAAALLSRQRRPVSDDEYRGSYDWNRAIVTVVSRLHAAKGEKT